MKSRYYGALKKINTSFTDQPAEHNSDNHFKVIHLFIIRGSEEINISSEHSDFNNFLLKLN